MQDIPLSYTITPTSPTTPTSIKKSRFNDVPVIRTNIVGYYKRIRRSVVFMLVDISSGNAPVLTNDMFFEDMDFSDSGSDSDSDSGKK
jgi:hypothetical protein